MERGAKSAKVKVKARGAVSNESQKVDGSTGPQLKQQLVAALEQYAAVSEILQVISASPSNVQPVLNAVAERAARLCQAPLARVLLVDGAVLRHMAEYSLDGKSQVPTVPIPLKRTTINGRAVLDRITIHHDDVVPLLDSEYPDALNARRLGLRAILAVPLIREGNAYGSIILWRREPGLFSPEQVALVQTFAQQAAIAVDSVRLFKETKEALEQQTATSEILRVISASPTDVQPVFDAIAHNSVALCGGMFANVFRFDGELVHWEASAQYAGAPLELLRSAYPMRPSRSQVSGRVIMSGAVVRLEDALADPEFDHRFPMSGGWRRMLGVPMLRDGNPIGVIVVGWSEPGAVPKAQEELLKTFADQAVIAIENVRLFTELEARNKDLTQLLEQQTATSDMLRVISQSPSDVQPVFDTIAQSAMKLCAANIALLATFDGELIHLGAISNATAEGAESVRKTFPRPPGKDSASARAVYLNSVVVIPDIMDDRDYTVQQNALVTGFRSILAVPLTRDGAPIGAITVGRPAPGLFSEREIALLKTFADQAVIAIENSRLFNETQSALARQTATADVLRVISRSPTDVQPVFDAIVATAVRLLACDLAVMLTCDSERFSPVAGATSDGRFDDLGPTAVCIDPAANFPSRAIRERAVVQIPDWSAVDLPEHERRIHERVIHRDLRISASLYVPILRAGECIGVMALARTKVGAFGDAEVALAQSFVDQAVIAIENVRLFNETKEALEQQTATSEILRVISQSPMSVQPVFDTIVGATLRLCSARSANLFTFDGQMLHLAAHARPPGGQDDSVAVDSLAMHSNFPRPPSRELAAPRAVLTRAVVSIPDVLADPEYTFKDAALAGGFRSVLAVPLIREGGPIGAIVVGRPEPGLFPEIQIALLKTFADQGVIAIENVRLFKELEARTTQLTRSVGELKALGEVGQAVSSTLDLETVLRTIVARATELAGMDGGSIYEYDEAREVFHLHTTYRLPAEVVDALRASPIPKGEGALGRLAVTGEVVQIRDISDEAVYKSRVRKMLLRSGYRALLAVPLLRENHLLGGLVVNRATPGEFAPEVIDLLKTFATQSALAIQNARLFLEIGDKSRQLEVASRHKSEFLANMSHELRTPLNAIIGFSEVLAERMFGEVNDKQAEYLADILESGGHLLSLINDILDLSKIEAGRMELEASDFDLPSAIESTLMLVRERAHRRGIALARNIDERLAMIRGDERKVKQVLLNLLSNALKFTPEGGQIGVQAELRDGAAEISVTDTGVGIAPEDQEAVFEEFRQVGTASKKVEGTGLGLAISRKFIELHGGKIWVKSQVGAGSTFAFTLPLTIDQRH